MSFKKFESHVAGHGEKMWNQSYYFNAYDPSTGTGCLIRVGLLENLNESNSWLIVFQDGLPVFTRTNLQLPYIHSRPGDEGGMQIAGMHLESLEPLRKARVSFEDRDFAIDLVWDAMHDLADCIAMSKGDSGTFADEMAHVHLEGPCHVHGNLVVRGNKFSFKGTGMRDIAAGVRNWDSLSNYRLAWPIFENGMVFCGVKGTNTAQQSAFMRMFNNGEKWLRVAEINDHNAYDEACPFTVKEMNWSFTDELGHAHQFSAKPVFKWLFAQDTFVVCEQMMEFKLEDGTVGYGLCEGGFRLPWKQV
jgi:hypothetical protein